MRHFRTLLAHELRSAVLSWNTWAAGALFLALMGSIHWFAVLESSRSPQDWTPVEATFRLFWLPLLCVLPLLTMRSFAEERRSGTLAALLTTPASPAAVVWAKFLSVWVVWMVFWLLFTIFPLLVEIQLGSPGDHRLSEPSMLWGGICFVAVRGLMHASIGLLCSCVTRSSALAALLAFISLLAVVSWEWLGWLREPAAHLRTFAHLQDFASGILDSRPIILYATGTLLCLGLANLAIEDQE